MLGRTGVASGTFSNYPLNDGFWDNLNFHTLKQLRFIPQQLPNVVNLVTMLWIKKKSNAPFWKFWKNEVCLTWNIKCKKCELTGWCRHRRLRLRHPVTCFVTFTTGYIKNLTALFTAKVQSINTDAHKRKKKPPTTKNSRTIRNLPSTEVKLHIRYSSVPHGRLR